MPKNLSDIDFSRYVPMPPTDIITVVTKQTLRPIKEQVELIYLATRRSDDLVARDMIDLLYKNIVRAWNEIGP
jgi:hypothetical protein